MTEYFRVDDSKNPRRLEEAIWILSRFSCNILKRLGAGHLEYYFHSFIACTISGGKSADMICPSKFTRSP